jgi:glycosyltransferase involved in cell wall biosynthesis
VKIVYLHQYFVTPEMPGGTRSYEMARRLVAAGHDVHIVTTNQQPANGGRGWHESTTQGIHVHTLDVRYDNQMSNAARIRAFMRFALASARRAASLKGDVIFATSTPLTVAIPALFASTIGSTPFVFEVRDMWPDVPIAIGALKNPLAVWLAKQLELTAYRRAKHVVALAPGMREDIIAKGIAADKVSVIPNGCDLDVFATASGPSPRGEYPWLGDRKLLLYPGTIGKVNGVDYLVRLAAAMAERDPEVRFAVIGRGRERDAVRALAEQHGVLDRSFFMMDALPKVELARWMRAADMVVALITGPRVIWKDGVQNKFFDALAAGRPVASSFDGWQSQVATAEGVGLILDPNDASAAADLLLRTLHDEPWNARARVRARELAEGRFNRDRLAGELERVLVAAVQ